jgi:hypothetical protein
LKPELSKILIERGVIRESTIVEAYHFTKGLSCTNNSKVLGEFAVIRALKRGNDIVFDVLTRDNIKEEIDALDVITVDGMDEPRLAKAFMLTIDGNKLSAGKRRGRKPKGYVEERTSEDDIRQAEEFIQLLNYGWSEENIAQKYNIPLEEVNRILDVYGFVNDENDFDEEEFEEDEFDESYN